MKAKPRNNPSSQKIHLINSIAYFSNQEIIEIKVGLDSLPIWFALTVDIERFLDCETVAEILKQQPLTGSRWLTAQAVFNRIAAASGPVSITIAEADAGADLLACMFLAYKEPSLSGQWRRSLLEIWAQVARYKFEPLFKLSLDCWKPLAHEQMPNRSTPRW